MYQVNLANVKKKFRYILIFCVIGVIFLLLAFILSIMNIYERISLTENVVAIKVEDNCITNRESGSTLCSPIYYYQVKEDVLTCESSKSTEKFSFSKNKVYYNPNNPSTCMTEFDYATNPLIFFFFSLGALFILLFVIYFISYLKRMKTIQYLVDYGTLEKNLNFTMESVIPFGKVPAVNYLLPDGTTIHIRGDVGLKVPIYKSDNKIDLLIDLDNPTKSFLDFDIEKNGENMDKGRMFPSDLLKEEESNEELSSPPSSLYSNMVNPVMNNREEDDRNY